MCERRTETRHLAWARAAVEEQRYKLLCALADRTKDPVLTEAANGTDVLDEEEQDRVDELFDRATSIFRERDDVLRLRSELDDALRSALDQAIRERDERESGR